jgi:S-adenosylmethionine decarboxylase
LQALGRHLLLELFDCDAEAINSLEVVKASMVEAAKRAQATIVDVVFHEFNPFGISGVVVIAESHLAIHTWPEYRYAAVDVFSCGDVLQPQVAADYLVEQFGAVQASVVELKRGILLNTGVAAARPRPVPVSSRPAASAVKPSVTARKASPAVKVGGGPAAVASGVTPVVSPGVSPIGSKVALPR